MMTRPTTGVVMLNMGAPDTEADVQPYLENIFLDPDIIDIPLGFLIRRPLARMISRRRAPNSAKKYDAIGGSPLNRIAWEQAEALADALAERGVEADARPGMRYWRPFTADALKEWRGDGLRNVVALSMYPLYSRVVGGSSLKDFRATARTLPSDMNIIEIDGWHLAEFHIDFLERAIRDKLPEEQADLERTAVLFTAHGTPQKVADRGDPYSHQCQEVFRLVRDRLPKEVNVQLGYQSAIGPMKWLRPYTDELIRELDTERVRRLVICPLGFVADNMETLWDIECDLMPLAREHGVAEVERARCPNIDAAFIAGLADLVVARLRENERSR